MNSRKYGMLFGIVFCACVYEFPKFRALLLGHFKDFSLKMVLLQISAAAAVAILEFIFIGWEASSVRKLLRPSPSVKRDIALYLLDISSVLGLIGKVLVLGIPYFIIPVAYEAIQRHTSFSFANSIHSALALYIIYLLLTDLSLYWMHRIFHRYPAAWELHQYHHSATEFCILTASRDHPLVVPLWIFFVGIPSLFFGAALHVFYPLIWLNLVHSYLLHSEIESDWGFIGRWIFVPPKAHRLHHSLDEAHWGRNYGFMFAFWDRLFRSRLHISEPVQSIGIVGDYYNKGNLFHEMIVGIQRCATTLFGPVAYALTAKQNPTRR